MRLSLSTWVLVGFIAGIALGLFGGEYCAPLQIVGDLYIGLLQMTVLPYIVASLILNLGRLDMATCRRLAAAATIVLGLLWLIVAALLVLLPLALPEWQAGSFFSTGMLEAPREIDVLELFIPTNPFQALAENVVPATVLFSICVGVALIGVENKQPLLDNLQSLLNAMGRINHLTALASPVGVFAIMAATAGTISLDQFTRLQVYLLIYLVGTVLLVLLILPLLVSLTTSIGYFAFLRVAWAPMLTAFATGKTLVVLPMIAEGSAQLLRDSGEPVSVEAEPSALVALAYPFPHLGKLMGLLFLPFAAWFVGSPMSWSDYPGVLAAGLVSMFGSVVAAIPFLLDLEHLPADLFQMFVASGVICGRLGDLVGVVSLFAFTLLTTRVLQRRLRVDVRSLFVRGLATVTLVLVSIGMLRGALNPLVRSLPSNEQVLLSMHTAVVPLPHRELAAPPSLDSAEPGLSRLQRIHQRGALVVGCLEDSLPFAFRNESGQLVGFDIDMAHLLASELGCELWLVPLSFEELTAALANDTIDLVMSGVAMTTDRLQVATFSRPYMRVTMSLMVPDFRRREFSSLGSIQRMTHLRIAAMPSRRFEEQLTRVFPQAEVVTIQTPREFFTDPALKANAMLISAEAGSAWSLIYPSYTPVIPQPQMYQVPLGYPVAGKDSEFAEFMSQWIELKSTSPEFSEMYDYWILGRSAEKKPPRWCILRDVLGWAP